MQKSKAPIIIFSVLIIVLIIVAIVLIFNENKSDRTTSMYNNICRHQNFTFNMEELNQEIEYRISISQKSTDICIDMFSGEEHTSTLVLESEAYFIMHNEQEYYVYDSEDIEADSLIDELKKLSGKQYQNGREKINGITYYYEEYIDFSTFIMLLNPTEQANITTRFYFDGDDIAYIKNIIQENGEIQEELLKINLQFEADESLFEIPEDYAEI